MADSDISVSVVINAPVERAWPLLIEHQQSNESKMMEQKYFQKDPDGPPVAGQVVHMKWGCLHSTIYIDRIVQADPPSDGQTISARMTFLRKEGQIVAHQVHDSEHYYIQTQLEIKHPWFKMTEQTSIRCIAIDAASCVVVYVTQSETTIRLVPRWLAQRLDNGEITTKVIETSLQRIKTKAEQNLNHARLV